MSKNKSKLQQAFESGNFVVTGELGPPKGINVEPCLEDAEKYLKNTVTAVNVTDGQTAVMRIGSIGISKLLIEKGIEPVFQMTCRDRNRIALQMDLLSAAALGIKNVLALTGDHVAMGDHPEAKPVFDLDSVSLLQAICSLEEGTDMGKDMKGEANKLNGTPEFFKGCCVTPCADELEPQVIKLEQKIQAGAQFVQTQAVYDPVAFEKFIKKVEHLKVPIMVGIVILKTAGMAKYMNKSVPGVNVPEDLIKRLADAAKEDRQKIAVDICGELISKMKNCCQGAHLMTMGWDHCVPDILKAAGLT